MGKETKRKLDWKAHFENLEDRFLMSADPVGGLMGGSIVHHQDFDGGVVHHQESLPDFWIEETDEGLIHHELEQIEKALANAHNQTGQSEVIADYGFDGGGQTVAIIDSGIAYDHYALGGGFGNGYRVVGGWDFTGENDANPYDDGPSGSHGTHVAGIVGSDSGTHQGVATGVDFVGLRVFDDSGAGYFSWVENALQWIHDNQYSFDSPITTVNLSLGVSGWNSDTIPSWAMLEDEFAQLEADGIFISVSAGNAFTSYNAAGLSYPAASSYVVPVMSLDDNGSVSYFSQRHSRAIAAPGRTIVSTVPDYAGNNNNIADDWASMSGTSMAAPYLAGASALIREAMEFVGYANITQDMIYDHIVDTADSVWDSTTNAWYNSLNLEAAIDALMPTDDFGSTLGSAFDLGTITDTDSVSGLIGTLDDADYFSFTSGVTGTVTFTASSMTHDLEAAWQLDGGGGEVSGDANEVFTFDVVAGQDYTLGFSSADGLGYYDFDITSEASFSFIDLGAVTFSELEGTSSVNEQWYRIETTSAGYVSVEGFFDTVNGQISLHLFDTNMQEIGFGVGNGENGVDRVDTYASAGEELFVCVLGTNADVDLRLSNLVSLEGTTVQVNGTDGDDVFSFTAGGSAHTVIVNDVHYEFVTIAVTNVNFNGGVGNDSITLTGTAGNETATLRVLDAQLSGAGYVVNAAEIENVSVDGGGGSDLAVVYDSSGNDLYSAWSDRVSMAGTGFSNEAWNFDRTLTFANSGGYDEGVFYDSIGNDVYSAWSSRAYMIGDGYFNDTYGLEHTVAFSHLGGSDRAVLYDSAGDDVYLARSDRTYMIGNGFFNDAYGFSRTTAVANAGGYDRAVIYDTAGDDEYRVWSDRAYMTGDGYFNETRGFDHRNAVASSGGYDQAILYDSAGDDQYRVWADRAHMSGDGYLNEIQGFDRTAALSTAGGYDWVVFYDTAGDDVYAAWSARAYMAGTGYMNDTHGFDRTVAMASQGGNDRAVFYDTLGDDVHVAWSNRAYMAGYGFFNDAHGFERTIAHSTAGGSDRAIVYDSTSNDFILARAWGAYLSSSFHHSELRGFDRVSAHLVNGGDNLVDADAVDFVFDLEGQWS